MYTLISRTGCHLCEQAEAALARICQTEQIDWRRVEIDDDPAYGRFSDDLPVLLDERGSVVASLTSSEAALRRAVAKPWYRNLFRR